MEKRNKKIVILTKANDTYGYGHIVRSLRHFEILKKDFSCRLIVLGDKNLKKNLFFFNDEEKIFLCERNKNEIEKIIKKFSPKILVIDLLDIEKDGINFLQKLDNVNKIWLSDLGKYHSDVDNILVTNPREVWQDNAENMTNCMDFLYFNEKLQLLRKINFLKNNYVYINAGGITSNDSKKTLYKVISRLEKYKLKGFLNIGFSRATHKNITKNFKCISHTDDHYKYIRKARIAIIASGFTRYEMAYVGMPTLLFSLNEHQKKLAIDFCNKKLGIYIGDLDNICSRNNLEKINSFFGDYSLQKLLIRNCKNKIDITPTSFLEKIRSLM